MRIAQVAPLQERVPPERYGGTEAVVHVLTEELVRRGHQVTLFASGDSITSAELVSVWPHSLRTARHIVNQQPYEWLHAGAALEMAEQFDILHNHQGELMIAMSRLVTTPMLTTTHNPASKDLRFAWQYYQGFYNTVSKAAKRGMPYPNWVGAIYNAIDVASFPFSDRKDDYMLFVGRMSADKGPHTAIDVAKRLGRKLLIAGKVGVEDEEHFENVVKPMIDGKVVEFLGEADSTMKRHLYAGASCVLFPITWNEPFGLVIIEAMACGTPVVAFNAGAVPELLVHGETGFIVNDIDEMIQAVRRVDRIDPRRCRDHVAQHFDAPRLADDYLAAYQFVLEQDAARKEWPLRRRSA
ncbi:MAG: glycosyltransferase family 4 protein [Chloroflexi bacterium]|nr:glycosyltransferase family 4 protein [Chloroflexota bacterium]